MTNRLAAPLALVSSFLCFVAAAILPGTYQPAEAASSTRFVQVWDRGAQISIGIGVDARTNRLRCVSVVTGRAPAVVSVSVGRTPVLVRVGVPRNSETRCIALPRAVVVPPNAWIYTRSQATAPVRRTRLP